MILTAARVIVLGALLLGLTDISTGAAIGIAVVILAIGLLGVRMLDRRSPSLRLYALGEVLCGSLRLLGYSRSRAFGRSRRSVRLAARGHAHHGLSAHAFPSR